MLTTHVFDRGDPAIGNDALFAVKPELLYDFRLVQRSDDGAGLELDVQFALWPIDLETPDDNH